jgi:hypothetical protein
MRGDGEARWPTAQAPTAPLRGDDHEQARSCDYNKGGGRLMALDLVKSAFHRGIGKGRGSMKRAAVAMNVEAVPVSPHFDRSGSPRRSGVRPIGIRWGPHPAHKRAAVLEDFA